MSRLNQISALRERIMEREQAANRCLYLMRQNFTIHASAIDTSLGEELVRQARMNAANAPFMVGPHQVRWIENPTAVGLRRMGFVDDLKVGERRIVDHQGWYMDDDDCGFSGVEVYRGTVYRLPHTRGYLYGYDDPFSGDGPAVLSLTSVDELREAIQRADRIAEIAADDERAYRREHPEEEEAA